MTELGVSILGFSGTKKGMTVDQRIAFRYFVQEREITKFLHGGCIGADVEAHLVVSALDRPPWITVFLGDLLDFRASLQPPPNETFGPFPTLERNGYIADASDELVATPGGFKEVLRSGTWATVRYFRKRNKPVHFIFPDGSYKCEMP